MKEASLQCYVLLYTVNGLVLGGLKKWLKLSSWSKCDVQHSLVPLFKEVNDLGQRVILAHHLSPFVCLHL